MGDEQEGHAQIAAQYPQQVENLILNGHVKGGGRFVGDEQFRVAGEGNGDHHPLLHSPRKLMRICIVAQGRVGDAHPTEHGNGLFPGGGLVQTLVQTDHLNDLVADGEDRIEAGHRLLKNHGYFVAANPAHVSLGKRHQIGALEENAPTRMKGRRLLQQAHD